MTYLYPNSKKIRQEIVDQLKAAAKEDNQVLYQKKVAHILGLTEKSQTKESLIYLGGFVNGEGSVNVSIKKQKNTRLGVALDPEFSITQNIAGASMLLFALGYFKTGRITYKQGRNATLVFRIGARESLKTLVNPFFTKYMKDYCPESLIQRYNQFFKLLKCFDRDDHLCITSFEKNMLPIWEDMRVQDHITNSFQTTAEVMDYVRPIWERNRK